jgi:hypothetical protein
MHLVLLTLLLLIFATSDKRDCVPARAEQQTAWGHSHAELNMQSQPVKAAKGTVKALDDVPVENVLVEVFSHRGGDRPQKGDADPASDKRIAACVTSANGVFAFNIPSGHYEIRASKADWNSTSVLITVDTRKGKNTKLNVPLEVGA